MEDFDIEELISDVPRSGNMGGESSTDALIRQLSAKPQAAAYTTPAPPPPSVYRPSDPPSYVPPPTFAAAARAAPAVVGGGGGGGGHVHVWGRRAGFCATIFFGPLASAADVLCLPLLLLLLL